MSFESFITFWAVSMLFILTPGADWAYAMAAGIKGRAVIPAVSGLLLGHLTATLIVAAGVGALITSIPGALAVLTVVGALYLAWLGINLLRHPPVPTLGGEQDAGGRVQWVIKGFGVSGLNPKVFLMFLALLPQFTDPAGAWPVPVQIIALGLIHTFGCGVVYLLVGFGARKVLQARPRAARIVSRISGAAMLVIAVILIAEQALA